MMKNWLKKIIENPFYLNHFSPAPFKILFGVWKLDHYVSWCRYLWVYSTWNLLRLLNFNNYAFHKIEEVISNYIFKYSSVPFYLSCLAFPQCVWPSSLWNYACQVGYLHFFSLYSLSKNIIWNILSLQWTKPCSGSSVILRKISLFVLWPLVSLYLCWYPRGAVENQLLFPKHALPLHPVGPLLMLSCAWNPLLSSSVSRAVSFIRHFLRFLSSCLQSHRQRWTPLPFFIVHHALSICLL